MLHPVSSALAHRLWGPPPPAGPLDGPLDEFRPEDPLDDEDDDEAHATEV